MTHTQTNPDHRPVTPIDLEALIQEGFQIDEGGPSATSPAPVLLVDPTTRRIIAEPVSPALADEVQKVFERIEARAAGQTREATEALSKVRGLIGEACMVAHNMRALTYLFTKAVCDDGADTPLTAASHLVIDCLESMAARIENLEVTAEAVFHPFTRGPWG